MMSSVKFSVALWVLVGVSAFAVILSSFNSRQSFFEWQALLKQAQGFDVEWGQLLIEKSSLASYSRLEDVAKDELKMTAPKTDRIIVVQGGSQ